MPAFENTMKKKLEAGGCVFSLTASAMRQPGIALMAKECGFDWLFIDTEHSSMDVDTVSTLCVAALPTGVTPIVRVPGHQSFHASRVLDGGAMGVVVPHVNSVAEAQAVVTNCRFPPLGLRSLTGLSPQLGYQPTPMDEATRILNDLTFVTVMIETPEAVENADAIAAVPGIDCVMVGCNDLAATMGIAGKVGDPKIEAALKTVIEACARHNKYPGMGGVYAHPLMEKYLEMGVRFCLAGGDHSLMMSAGRDRMNFLNRFQA
tara:strand:+ start:893 stop:1678 length:786 start_codon:yes stop_codon:yes gene_type:complete